ncbi:hypothetical protein MKW92_036677, partial [Papaver armeniacum]
MEFSDRRDADDLRIFLDGHDVDGIQIIVEFSKGMLIYWIIGPVAKVANLFLSITFRGHIKEVVEVDMVGSCGEVLMVTGIGIVKLETGGITSSICNVFLIFSLRLHVYNDVEQTPVSAQVVGNVGQYYHILHQSPELDINQKILSLNSIDYIRVKNW